ncbi:HNH endonuclease [Micrococcaceae bacterium Sec5.1]
MSDSIDHSLVRLSALTGIPLVRCTVSNAGILAEGGRLAGVSEGKGLVVALTRTITSSAAIVMPEDSAGGLVRRLGRWAQENPDAWGAALNEFDALNLALTFSVNHEILDDPREIPDGLWRAFAIECFRRSPAKTKEQITESLVQVAWPALALALNGILEQDEQAPLSEFESLPEGAVMSVKVNRYERNPLNRLRCISHYGCECWACDLDFEKTYGPPAAGFIEVHHRIPVSAMGEGYMADPIRDLVPLCSNCHSVAHRRNPPYQPWELRELLGLAPKKPELPIVGTETSDIDYVLSGVSVTFDGGATVPSMPSAPLKR